MPKQITQTLWVPPLVTTARGFGLHIDGTLKKTPRILYCNQNMVIQREVENVNEARINPEHSIKANVAKFHPNGEWICSGDDGGQCHVWAYKSFVIKNSIVVGKKVLDIAWSHDGQRIVAVGAGKDDKGKVFPWNSDNKLGELGGANKGFLTCDFKPSRPFRVITGSEDFGVYFYVGPPFKFKSYDRSHKNYVNCTRYNHKGDRYISVSTDKTMNVFDGKEGKKLRTIVDKKNGHKGTIYSVSFSPDDKFIVTASADKTCKIWNFEDGTVVHTFKFAEKPTPLDMQVSCKWLGDTIYSVSLNGKINYLNKDKGEKPYKILTGHKKTITDLAVDSANGYVYTCDVDSRVCRTECKTGDVEDVVGSVHGKTQIKYISLSSDNQRLYTVGVDDRIVISDISKELRLNDKKDDAIKIDGSARCLLTTNTRNANDELIITATHKSKVFIYSGRKLIHTFETPEEPTCGAISYDDKTLAIGCVKGIIQLYNIENNEFKETKTIKNNFLRNQMVCVEFSRDSKFLSSSDKNRHIWVWDTSGDYSEPVNKGDSYQFHNAVPCTLSWNPKSNNLISGGLDNTIYCWTNPCGGTSDNVHLERAFFKNIRKIEYLTDDTFVGISADCTIRFFKVET